MPVRPPALRASRGLLIGSAVSVLAVLVMHPFDKLPDGVGALVLVLPVLIGAVIGGRPAAMGVAVVATVAFTFEFVHPKGSLLVHTVEGFVGLVVFLAIAIVVGTLMAREAERRRHAEEQRDETARMHEQFKALTAERERLAEEARRVQVLEESDRQRAALLRSVSHDLRSPLVTIRAVSSDLRDGIAFDDLTRTHLLDLVVTEAERLDRIVANLLSMSRIEAGAFQPDRQPSDVSEIVERSVGRLRRLFEPDALHVDVPAGLPLADVDATQIDQVIANLLENAARHTPVGTPVTVSAAHEGDAIRITVADEGPGIDPVLRDRLLAPFVSSGLGASTGIGLAICQAIVAAHDGTLAVDGHRGAGTGISFTVPVAT